MYSGRNLNFQEHLKIYLSIVSIRKVYLKKNRFVPLTNWQLNVFFRIISCIIESTRCIDRLHGVLKRSGFSKDRIIFAKYTAG